MFTSSLLSSLGLAGEKVVCAEHQRVWRGEWLCTKGIRPLHSYLVCVPCVQMKAVWEDKLESWTPTNTHGRRTRKYLEQKVQECVSYLNPWKQQLVACMARLQDLGQSIVQMLHQIPPIGSLDHSYWICVGLSRLLGIICTGISYHKVSTSLSDWCWVTITWLPHPVHSHRLPYHDI